MTIDGQNMTNPEFRGSFHFSPPQGWMNDPNGFSYFKGRFHLFYQHNPDASVWGPMHWGHAISEDLIKWKNLPIALKPSEDYDANGCWSGGAIADGERHVLVYTGNAEPEPEHPQSRRQTQCLAFGDGIEYRKAIANPVIGTDLLPPGSSAADFRDPKIWKEGKDWYCLVANCRLDGKGQILLFTAVEPSRWRYVAPVLTGEGRLAGMIECPDLFPLGDKDVLVWSVMDMAAEEGNFQNPQTVVWAAGRLDRKTGALAHGSICEIDKGPDFYAPQTLAAPDGRTILIGWMQAWHRSMPTHELGHGWAGQMTIPREVFWKEDCIAQRPIRELESYRGAEVEHAKHFSGSTRLPGVEGQLLDLELVFDAEGDGRVGVRLFVGDCERTEISWDTRTGWLTLDRSRGGMPIHSDAPSHPECQVYKARIRRDQNKLNLRIILDRSSIELFAQGGTTVMTSTVYPRSSSSGVEFFSDGCQTRLECRAWPLCGERAADMPIYGTPTRAITDAVRSP